MFSDYCIMYYIIIYFQLLYDIYYSFYIIDYSCYVMYINYIIIYFQIIIPSDYYADILFDDYYHLSNLLNIISQIFKNLLN